MGPASDSVDPDAGAADSTGAAGSTSTIPGEEPLSERSGSIGRPCATDADCLAPLDCIQASSNDEFRDGGPQGGYCSFRCSANEECTALDELSACNTTLGRCFAMCLIGPSEVKCGSDRAQVCVDLQQGELGACIPRCTSDAACGPGRFCDPGISGLCKDEARVGRGVGAPCNVATASADCASELCIEYVDPADESVILGSFCSANCVFGLANGCGFDGLSSGARTSACLAPQFANGQVGELGYCAPLCNTTGDCTQRNAGWVCDPFDDPNAVAQVGRFGECLPAEAATP
jgi:hypothetical protein